MKVSIAYDDVSSDKIMNGLRQLGLKPVHCRYGLEVEVEIVDRDVLRDVSGNYRFGILCVGIINEERV